MINLSFLACSFYLRKYNSKSDETIIDLNKKIEYNKSNNSKIFDNAYQLFLSFIKDNSDLKDDETSQKMFSCRLYKKGTTKNGSYVSFIVSSGQYGEKTNIKNKSGKTTHKKKADEFEEREFLVVAVFPFSDDYKVVKGILLFQNWGPFGVKTLTKEYLQAYIKDNAGLSFYTRNIATDVFLDALFKNSTISDIILINNKLSDDSSDGCGYGMEQRIFSKLKLEESFLSKLKTFANNKNNLFEFDEEYYDKVKIKTNVNNRKRTLDLHRLDMISTIDSLPNEFINTEGSLELASVFEYLMKMADTYLDRMVLNEI